MPTEDNYKGEDLIFINSVLDLSHLAAARNPLPLKITNSLIGLANAKHKDKTQIMKKMFAQLISASLLTVALSLPINNNASAQSGTPVKVLVEKKTKQLSLSIKFTVKQENIDRFKQSLIDLFRTISNEKNFVNATLHQDIANPGEFLVYETWNDNIEHFINVQMKKPYALKWEALLTELEIKRQAGAFIPFARFGTSR